jgi:hypothetical protein
MINRYLFKMHRSQVQVGSTVAQGCIHFTGKLSPIHLPQPTALRPLTGYSIGSPNCAASFACWMKDSGIVYILKAKRVSEGKDSNHPVLLVLPGQSFSRYSEGGKRILCRSTLRIARVIRKHLRRGPQDFQGQSRYLEQMHPATARVPRTCRTMAYRSWPHEFSL